MASDVIMPKMGYDMTSGVLARWLKQPGDPVHRGDAIAEVETDKVTIEIEAFDDGTVGTLLVKEGDRVPVGASIATLETAGAPADRTVIRPVGAGEGGEALPSKERAGAADAEVIGFRAGALPAAAAAIQPQAGGPMPAAMAEPVAAPPAGDEGVGRIKASPLARKLAQQHDIDLAVVSGSGPGGRIQKTDIESRIQAPEERPAATLSQPIQAPAPLPPTPTKARPDSPSPFRERGPGGEVPAPLSLSRGQQAVGRVMAHSKQTVPHFYVTVAVTMDDALDLRAALNAVLPEADRVGILDLILMATAQALAATPAMRRLYPEGGPIAAADVHLAIAVAMNDGAIVSPVLQNADRMPLTAMARRSRQLIRDARSGRLSMDALQGGIFTVSSLGSAGVESFAAIITPPQSGVLAVGSVQPEPVARDGDLKVEQRLRLTLSADHRLVGGVEAAAFLNAIRQRLESPYRLLVDNEAGER